MLPAPSTSSRSRPPLANLLIKARESLGKAVNGGSSLNDDDLHNYKRQARSKLLSTPLAPSPAIASQSSTSSISSFLRALLPSPKTAAFVSSCLLWYLASALSSNTSKALLSSPKAKSPSDVRSLPPFPYPVTLTLIQFVFIHLLSSAVASPTFMQHVPGVRKPVTRIVRDPGWQRLSDMAKLSVFNVVGHAFSTVAISRVPVSTVHTIKALTPLFTVLSFRYIFKVHYSFMAYFSLVPLTLGVMMACTSLSFSANDLVGLSTALASTFIFVAQSIYSKNLVGRGADEKRRSAASSTSAAATGNDKEASGKLDKINILYYTSACSIIIMIPMSLYYDGAKMLYGSGRIDAAASLSAPLVAASAPHATTTYIAAMITANGLVQFAQNFLAFSVLALVSPVTYSIASLFKRVFVICFAIIWFGQAVSHLQWLGILLTFVGLYIYNDAKSSKSIAKGEEMLERQERRKSMSLPTTARGAAWLNDVPNKNAAVGTTPTSSAWSAATQTAFSARQGSAYPSLTGVMTGHPSSARSISLKRPYNTESIERSDTGHGLPGAQDSGSNSSSIVPGGHPSSSATSAQPFSAAAMSDDDPVRFPVDPRRSIPSPPPSRGPSSDDEGTCSKSS